MPFTAERQSKQRIRRGKKKNTSSSLLSANSLLALSLCGEWLCKFRFLLSKDKEAAGGCPPRGKKWIDRSNQRPAILF